MIKNQYLYIKLERVRKKGETEPERDGKRGGGRAGLEHPVYRLGILKKLFS